jgi:hypothetical protein
MPQQFHTGDQTLVRELNRSIILNQLRIGSPLSRADLAAIPQPAADELCQSVP